MAWPSGEQIELRAAGYTVVVVTQGAGLRQLRWRGHDLLDGYPPEAVCQHGRGQVLAPWPNRVRDGRYRAGGSSHQLDISEPARGHAIHGLVRWAWWTLVEHAEDHCRLSYALTATPGYPWRCDIEVGYSLSEAGLRVDAAITNRGPDAAPAGIGFHPYLSAGGGLIDHCRLELPATAVQVVDGALIPVSRRPVPAEWDFRSSRSLGPVGFDTEFLELERGPGGRASVGWLRPDGIEVSLWMGPELDHVMLFTGDGLGAAQRRRGLAVEPMSCAADAFNSGDGLWTLAAGERRTVEWGIAAAAESREAAPEG